MAGRIDRFAVLWLRSNDYFQEKIIRRVYFWARFFKITYSKSKSPYGKWWKWHYPLLKMTEKPQVPSSGHCRDGDLRLFSNISYFTMLFFHFPPSDFCLGAGYFNRPGPEVDCFYSGNGLKVSFSTTPLNRKLQMHNCFAWKAYNLTGVDTARHTTVLMEAKIFLTNRKYSQQAVFPRAKSLDSFWLKHEF